MEEAWSAALYYMAAEPMLAVVAVLVVGVVFVNGWTDAPNAIATCVATRVVSPSSAVAMAAVFNFAGVFCMTILNRQVAFTIFHLARFDQMGTEQGSSLMLTALAAALFAIIVWAVAAWWFGIPTSESHALLAGVTGAAVAMGGWGSVRPEEWKKVVIGLLFSTIFGFAAGYITARLVRVTFSGMPRARAFRLFGHAQLAGGAAMAFMHGAQDGQKFLGVLMLALALAGGGQTAGAQTVPLWLVALVSLMMSAGTCVGGYRIIRAVGMGMVRLKRHQGFAADVAASVCLLISTLYGFPVSTTHTKTTAVMGVGAAHRLRAVHWGVVGEMAAAWVLTFPGCGLIAYSMTKLFLWLSGIW